MLCIVRVLFILGVALATARAFAAAVNLSTSLRSHQISPTTIQLLNLGETRDVNLRRLVTMDRWLLEQDKGLTRRRAEDLRDYVRSVGLDFYLTPEELVVYRGAGVTPPVSLASRVDRLDLSFNARGVLKRLDVRIVGESSALTRERLAAAGASSRIVREIATTLDSLGVTLWSTPAERDAGRGGRLAAELIPLDRLGLDAAVVDILRAENIWNLDELKARDRRSDLGEIRRLGRNSLDRIAAALRGRGHLVSWLDPVAGMNLTPQLIRDLAARRVTTRLGLRRFVERGAFARLVRHDLALINYVRRLLDGADCAPRLEVVDVEGERQS